MKVTQLFPFPGTDSITTEWWRGMEGVFVGLPAEVYHDAPGVSNSATKGDNLIPPARYPVRCREKFEPSIEMVMGTMVHDAILEPSKADARYVIKPDDVNYRTKIGREWRDAQTVPILTEGELATVKGCVLALGAHPAARRVFTSDGWSEVSIFRRLESGIIIKCRIDRVPRRGSIMADIKTCREGGASQIEFQKTLGDLDYYVQAAWYLDLWNHFAPEELKKTNFIFFPVEKAEPYLVAVYNVAENALTNARKVIQERLDIVSRYSASGVWPGYPEEPQDIDIATWKIKEITKQLGWGAEYGNI